MTEQVKYFTDNGEEIITLGNPPLSELPTIDDEPGSPWPAIVLVLGTFVIAASFVLGIVWILHG